MNKTRHFVFVYDVENILVSYESDKNLSKKIEGECEKIDWTKASQSTYQEITKSIMDKLGVKWELLFEMGEHGMCFTKDYEGNPDMRWFVFNWNDEAFAVCYESPLDLSEDLMNAEFTYDEDCKTIEELVKRCMDEVGASKWELIKYDFCYAC